MNVMLQVSQSSGDTRVSTDARCSVFLIAAGMYVHLRNCMPMLICHFVSYPCGPCILSILPNNSAGHYKKATAVALQLAIANCG